MPEKAVAVRTECAYALVEDVDRGPVGGKLFVIAWLRRRIVLFEVGQRLVREDDAPART